MKKEYQAPQAEIISLCQTESIADGDIDIGGGGASFGGGGLPDFSVSETTTDPY